MTDQMTADEIAAKLEQIGGKRWAKNGMDRVYINSLQDRIGLEVERYNTGNVSAATLAREDGSRYNISNSEARRALGAIETVKIYYDLPTGKLMLKGDRDSRGYVQQCIDSIQADIAKALAE